MKSLKRLLISLTVLLLMLGIFAQMPATGLAAQTGLTTMPEDWETYEEIPYTGGSGKTSKVVYSDRMVLQNANAESGDLAKVSVALSSASYEQDSINTLLLNMGFEEANINDYGSYAKLNDMTIYDCDYVGYTIASKPISCNGTDYILYCIPIKGTGANAEWYSDFKLGSGDVHEGFRIASEQVYNDLIDRLIDDGVPKDNTIVWLTGHSRGAACANLIAGWLSENEIVSSEHLFGYTYACPAVSLSADEALTNIYNYNNPGDMVPLLPLEQWGYKRYGQTVELSMDYLNNFRQQFRANYGAAYAGETTPDNYLALLTRLVPTINDFHSPGITLLMGIAGHALGGKTQSNYGDVILYSGYQIGSHAFEELSQTVSLVSFISKAQGLGGVYQGLIDFCEAASGETSEMTEEDFQAYLAAHPEEIQQLEEITGILIENSMAFQLAKNSLLALLANSGDIYDIAVAAKELVCDENGNVLDKITHAHSDVTYVTWINATFCGYRGWANYTPGEDEPSYSFPDNITAIESSCFQECNELTAVISSENLYYVGDYAFSNAFNLMPWFSSEHVQYVGNYAFRNSSVLQYLYIPNATTIGTQAFFDCDALIEVTVPVDYDITKKSFDDCNGVQTIHYTPGVTGIMGDRTIETNYTTHINNTMEMDSAHTLTTVEFAEGITHIGNYAFYRNTSYAATIALTNVTLPSTLESIGDYAFHNNPNIVEVSLPEGLRTLGEYCFYSCTSLSSAIIPSSMTEISNFCFYNCTGIQEVYIPQSISSIGDRAFYNCSGFSTLVIPDTVTSLGTWAFYNCDGITEISLPVDYDVTKRPFDSCNNVQTIHYTPGVTGIMGDRTIETNYTTHINNTMEMDSAHTLTTVEFAEGITHIGNYAFYRSTSYAATIALTNVSLPSTLESIGVYAFHNNPKLTELTLPTGVSELGSNAFGYCSGLTQVTFTGDAPTIANTTFSNVRATCRYPGGNETWTSDVMLNYGGTLTWTPYETTVSFLRASISLDGSIGINYFVELSPDILADPGAYMAFTFDGDTQIMPLAEAVLRDGAYVFTCRVPAKCIADTVTAQMYTSSGAVSEAKDYSVKAYCDAAIPVFSAYPAYGDMIQLMKAMLNYGTHSQIQLKHNVDHPANANLSDADKALADVPDLEEYTHFASGSEDGIAIYSATLLLESETIIRYYFRLTGDKTIDEYTFIVDGMEVEPVIYANNVYYVEKTNIAAKDLDEPYVAQVGGLSVTFCGLSYVRATLSTSTSEALLNVVNALYAYNQAANIYFGE